jgi:hypothetical protein
MKGRSFGFPETFGTRRFVRGSGNAIKVSVHLAGLLISWTICFLYSVCALSVYALCCATPFYLSLGFRYLLQT